ARHGLGGVGFDCGDDQPAGAPGVVGVERNDRDGLGGVEARGLYLVGLVCLLGSGAGVQRGDIGWGLGAGEDHFLGRIDADDSVERHGRDRPGDEALGIADAQEVLVG